MKTLRELFPKASAEFLRVNEKVLTAIADDIKADDKEPATFRLRRPNPRTMNATERSFSLMLEAQRNAGEIVSWRYESVKLRLGDGCWYVPDFFVERAADPLFVEVKGGFIREDARVKFIAAREIHHWAAFEMHQRTPLGWIRIL